MTEHKYLLRIESWLLTPKQFEDLKEYLYRKKIKYYVTDLGTKKAKPT